MGKLSQKRERNLWILSMALFIVCIPIAFLFYVPLIEHLFQVQPPTLSDPPIPEGETAPYILSVREVFNIGFFDVIDITAVTLLALLLFPAMAYRADRNWRDNIDDHIPSLLREISDAQKTGLPLPRAITESSKHQYGALTPELKKMASKISWGIPFYEALKSLTKTADTPLMKRTSLLILEAERSGGAIEDVFEAAHKHVSEILGLKRERLGAMKPYTMIIYASFIVFALVMLILLYSFFGILANQIVESVAEGQNPTARLPFNLAGLQLIFFHLMLIEAIFAGLIAGKMGEGDSKLGLRHSCILIGVSYAFFKIPIFFL